jgi:hypothetical protein
MDFFDKLQEHINLPETPQDMSPEREEELINGLVNYIVRYKLETPAILFFETVKPLSMIAGTFGQALAMSWIDFFGTRLFTELMLILQKKGAVEKLIKRIEDRIASER